MGNVQHPQHGGHAAALGAFPSSSIGAGGGASSSRPDLPAMEDVEMTERAPPLVMHGRTTNPAHPFHHQQQHQQPHEDVDDWVWPLEPADAAATRRLKRRAPSSVSSKTSGGSSSDSGGIRTLSASPGGVSLSDFDVLRVLGKGAHGTVFLVRHVDTNRLLAMKTLRKSSVFKNNEHQAVLTEFYVNKTLAKEQRCPYVATLRFAFHSSTRLFMVFDYLCGGELYTHLGRRGRIPEVLAKFYAAELALSIGYLHANGVAYRDLKPENLVLDATGHVNLIDFGLCRVGVTSPVAGIKSTSGTTEYLAPEVLAGMEHGLALDWWAFGMILFEFLTGLPPFFEEGDRDKIVQRILANTPVVFPDAVSPAARDLIAKLLVHDPSKRLGSPGGAREVMTHPFFEGVDWIKVARRGVEPPFVPPSLGASDEDGVPGLCNFDPTFTQKLVQVPSRDYQPPSEGDFFTAHGFAFDHRNTLPSSTTTTASNSASATTTA